MHAKLENTKEHKRTSFEKCKKSAKFNKFDSCKTFPREIFPQKVEVVSTSSGGKTFR